MNPMNLHQRGDISLYVTLIVGLTMLSSALLLGAILAQQISLTKDLVASERAFYAAFAGQEEAFYRLARKLKEPGTPAHPADVIMPNLDDNVIYDFLGIVENANFKGSISRRNGQICGTIEGTYKGEQRRIQTGPSAC